jgi:hypothetical protein
LEVDLECTGEGSGSLRDFARLDAGCADFHPVRATLGLLHANRLQIRIEPSLSAIVRVRDIVAELWSFTADFATFGHSYSTSIFQKLSFIANEFLKRQAGSADLWGSQLKEQS